MENKNTFTNLTSEQSFEIEKLAKSSRGQLDLGMGPIGEKIFTIFRDNNIQLLYFYLEPSDVNDLEAIYLAKYSSITNIYSYYIALNTAVPYDLQIFNACHEYYHHIDDVHEKLHLSRFGEPDDELLKAKANRFAAEFLLPTETLLSIVKKHNKGKIQLSNWNVLRLLRFIAQIQLDYQVPYRMIVKRLYEIEAIESNIQENLLSIKDRDVNSNYYTIGIALNSDEFRKLNSISRKFGVEAESLNILLQNYDENIVNLDSVTKDLGIFNKRIEEFGYEIEIDNDNFDEIAKLLGDK